MLPGRGDADKSSSGWGRRDWLLYLGESPSLSGVFLKTRDQPCLSTTVATRSTHLLHQVSQCRPLLCCISYMAQAMDPRDATFIPATADQMGRCAEPQAAMSGWDTRDVGGL